MKTITVNDIEYVKRSDVKYVESNHVCVIADRGWIFEGRRVSDKDGGVRLVDAHVVRKWSNGKGIGGLADPKYKNDYTLDEVGQIEIAEHAVIAIIPLRW